jgi:hypothetical protein
VVKPNRPPVGAGRLSIVRKIPVADRHDDQFILYEFQDRRFLKKVRRMKLETGELVEEVDGALVVVETGETLERV